MRPDTRSFSFTWLRGQKSSENVRQQQGLPPPPPLTEEGREDEDMTDSDAPVQNGTAAGENKCDAEGTAADGSWGTKRGNYGSRLRRLGNSLARLGGQRYASMEEAVEDENWHKINEELMPLDDDDIGDDEDEALDTFEVEMARIRGQKGPDVVQAAMSATTAAAAAKTVMVHPIPFKARTDNSSNVAVSGSSGDSAGEASTSTSSGLSLTKRLNKTVQDVKASFGNFSQVCFIIRKRIDKNIYGCGWKRRQP
jgi:hypothetical protein